MDTVCVRGFPQQGEPREIILYTPAVTGLFPAGHGGDDYFRYGPLGGAGLRQQLRQAGESVEHARVTAPGHRNATATQPGGVGPALLTQGAESGRDDGADAGPRR